jgi:hypothetical protein
VCQARSALWIQLTNLSLKFVYGFLHIAESLRTAERLLLTPFVST